jgi:hypothetical protein
MIQSNTSDGRNIMINIMTNYARPTLAYEALHIVQNKQIMLCNVHLFTSDCLLQVLEAFIMI